MIHMRTKEGIFNFRVAGILLHGDDILLHRMRGENVYSLPGGCVEMNESSKAALVREFREEIGVQVEVKRLLWINESFFSQRNARHHEICFYYLIRQVGGANIRKAQSFYGNELAKNGLPFLRFYWVKKEDIPHLKIRPAFLNSALVEPLPDTIVHIIS